MKKSPGKCKKSGCSLCKSENPLYKEIPSEKNLLLKSEHPLFLHFPGLFFKILLLKLKLLIYLEMPQKVDKKVGIHFYENVLAEMNLPLS